MATEPIQPVLPESERRWLHALLVLGTFVLGIFLLGQVATLLIFFSDILFILGMAFLFAFILSPVVSLILRAFPTLPRGLVTVLVYLILFVALTAVIVTVAGSLTTSVLDFVEQLPTLQQRLPEVLDPWQRQLASVGINVDLVNLARDALAGIGSITGDLVRPLADLALATLGAVGQVLLIVFLSLFIVTDQDRIAAFFNRLVPPRYAEEARLFETSVASSFGGFLRGQAIQGIIYAGFAVATHLLLGLDFMPVSAALVGLFQALPFFGAFVSWAPPVVVAALTSPGDVIPALIIMGIGWFIVMNIVQPRVMASAVGIHPVVVLMAVLIGFKLYGVVGAIFAVPVAAVISAFFFHYLNRTAGAPRDVASRAAKRVERRSGRPIRVPTAPALPPVAPGADANAVIESDEEERAPAVQRRSLLPRRPLLRPARPAGSAPPEGTLPGTADTQP
jgi:predicted PurR-regulated permease PerM